MRAQVYPPFSRRECQDAVCLKLSPGGGRNPAPFWVQTSLVSCEDGTSSAMTVQTMVVRLLLLTFLILAPLSQAQGQSDLCEVVFAPTPVRETMREVLKQPASFVNDTGEGGLRFDAEAFEHAWRALDRTKGEISAWSPQTAHDAKILRVRLRTKSSRQPLRVLITAGVHGNEPVGVVTAFDLIQAFSQNANLVGRDIELTVLPALNFDGLVSGRRRLTSGIDLNRAFTGELERDNKVIAIERAIGRGDFDLALDLHGSNERRQFFIIKQGPDANLANQAIEVLEPRLRLLSDDGKPTGGVGVHGLKGFDPNRYHLEAAGISTSVNQGTLKSYLATHGTRDAYTLEYPGQISFAQARAKNLALALAMIRRAALKD